MTSISECASTEQLYAHDFLSGQHSIQCADQPASERVGKVLEGTAASNAAGLLPPPIKFCRKAKCPERAASMDKTKDTDMSMDANRTRIFAAHRQYVHRLILETESTGGEESSLLSLWAASEGLFEVN